MPEPEMMSIEKVTSLVIDRIFKDADSRSKFASSISIDQLMDTDSGKAWQARAITEAVASAEAKVRSDVDAKLDASEKRALALGEKLQRKEQYERGFGVHRSVDGRVRASVSAESEKYLGDYARAYLKGDKTAMRALLTTGDGGVDFIQTDVANEVIRLVPETGLYPKIARLWPLTTTKQDIGHMLTKMEAFWPGEGLPATPSYPKSGKSVLEAKELVAYTEISQALLEDATVPIGQTLSDMSSESIGLELDRVGLVAKSVADGGTDAHTGALYADGINVLPMSKGRTSAGQIDWTDFAKLTVTPPEGGTDNCAFLISPTLLTYVMTALDGNGRPIWRMPGDGQGATICGRPYFTSYRMPSLPVPGDDGAYPSSPSAGLVLYGNWGKFAFYGLRKELRLDMSDTAGDNFKNRTVGIRAVTRAGVTTWGPAVAKLQTAPR
jgi:HK97 family phage major capsid protein